MPTDRGSTKGIGLRPRAPPPRPSPTTVWGRENGSNFPTCDRILPLSRDSGGGGRGEGALADASVIPFVEPGCLRLAR
jgi:hypothetical protein